MTRELKGKMPRLTVDALPEEIGLLIARVAEHVTRSQPLLPWGLIRVDAVRFGELKRSGVKIERGRLVTVVSERVGTGNRSFEVPHVFVDQGFLENRLPHWTLPSKEVPYLPVHWRSTGTNPDEWTLGDALLYELFTGLSSAMHRISWDPTQDPSRAEGREQTMNRLRELAAAAAIAEYNQRLIVGKPARTLADIEHIADDFMLRLPYVSELLRLPRLLRVLRKRKGLPKSPDLGILASLSPEATRSVEEAFAAASAIKLLGDWELRFGVPEAQQFAANRPMYKLLKGLPAIDGRPAEAGLTLDYNATPGSSPGEVTSDLLRAAKELPRAEQVRPFITPWIGRHAEQLTDSEIVALGYAGTNMAAVALEEWLDSAENAVSNSEPITPFGSRTSNNPLPSTVADAMRQIDSRSAHMFAGRARRLLGTGQTEHADLIELLTRNGTSRVRPDDHLYRTAAQAPLHTEHGSSHTDLPEWLGIALVGPNKPFGSMPVLTGRTTYGVSAEELIAYAEACGNKAVLVTDQTFMPEGFVIVYNEDAANSLLTEHAQALEDNNWPTDPDEFARRVVREMTDGPVEQVIMHAFADPRVRSERYRALRAQAADYIARYGPPPIDRPLAERIAVRLHLGLPPLLDEIPDSGRPIPAEFTTTISPGATPPPMTRELPEGRDLWFQDAEMISTTTEWQQHISEARSVLKGTSAARSNVLTPLVAAFRMHGVLITRARFTPDYEIAVRIADGDSKSWDRFENLLHRFTAEYRPPLGVSIEAPRDPPPEIALHGLGAPVRKAFEDYGQALVGFLMTEKWGRPTIGEPPPHRPERDDPGAEPGRTTTPDTPLDLDGGSGGAAPDPRRAEAVETTNTTTGQPTPRRASGSTERPGLGTEFAADFLPPGHPLRRSDRAPRSGADVTSRRIPDLDLDLGIVPPESTGRD